MIVIEDGGAMLWVGDSEVKEVVSEAALDSVYGGTSCIRDPDNRN